MLIERVIVLEERRKRRARPVEKTPERKWKSGELIRIFRMAKVNFPPPQVIMLTRCDLGTVGVNASIATKLGPHGHRAIEEIRAALQLSGSRPVSGANYERVPKGSGDWTDSQVSLWRRFTLWAWIMSLDPHLMRARDAAIFFAKGYTLREVEDQAKVRHGNGREEIHRGAREYCEMAGWIPATYF